MRNAQKDLELCGKTRKPIPGFPGYEADEDGFIWSVNSNWRGYGERKLTAFKNKYGYLKVKLTIEGKTIKKSVHSLVCMAFRGIKQIDKNLVRNR